MKVGHPLLLSLLAMLSLSAASARADYYGGDSGYAGGGYNGSTYSGGAYGGGYGGGGGYGNYGGGGGSMSSIISLELDAQKSLNSGLRVAARENRLRDLERLVARGGDVNGQSDAGDTALI